MEKVFGLGLALYFITNAQHSGPGIKITLQNEQVVTLLKSHSSYDSFAKLISRALIRKQPVGISISEDGEVLLVQRADNDIVMNLIPKGKDALAVYFYGHDGIFSLDRNHPRFDRIQTILEKSRTGSQRVWFIAQHPKLILLDAMLSDTK